MYKLDKPREKLYCEECDKEIEYKITSRKDTYNVKGEPIEIEAKIAVCPVCNSELFEPYLENNNLKKAYLTYMNEHGLVTPDEVKGIRKKYGLSQALFAKSLGLGEATVQRYENGSIPNKVNSDLIKTVKDPKKFLEILEKNKNKLAPTDYNSIKRRAEKLIGTSKSSSSTNDLVEVLNTYLQMNGDKLAGLVAEIMLQLKKLFNHEYTYKTKLYKLMWFIEDEYYQRYGKTLTGLSYAHLPYGPVPNNHVLVMTYLLTRDTLTEKTIEKENGEEITKIYLKETNAAKYLSDDEKELVRKIVKKYGGFSAKELSDISHRDSRYRETKNGEIMLLNDS